jgi:hypothetical protein
MLPLAVALIVLWSAGALLVCVCACIVSARLSRSEELRA